MVGEDGLAPPVGVPTTRVGQKSRSPEAQWSQTGLLLRGARPRAGPIASTAGRLAGELEYVSNLARPGVSPPSPGAFSGQLEREYPLIVAGPAQTAVPTGSDDVALPGQRGWAMDIVLPTPSQPFVLRATMACAAAPPISHPPGLVA